MEFISKNLILDLVVDPEIFSNEEIEYLIVDNRKTVESRGQPFGVDREILSMILHDVNSFSNITDKRARIIRKAADLLSGIVYHQPFNDGNKESALSWTIWFLRKNGFNLSLQNRQVKTDVYDLMTATSLKFEGEDIVSMVEEYLSEKVVLLD